MPRLTQQNRSFLDKFRTDPLHRHIENYMATYPLCKNRKTAAAAASRVMANPLAVKYLEKKAARAAGAADLKEEDILRDLMEVRDKCMGREDSAFVKVTKDGDIVEGEAADFNANGATKSLELLGKTMKMFTDKVETNSNMEVEFNFDFTGEKKKEAGG